MTIAKLENKIQEMKYLYFNMLCTGDVEKAEDVNDEMKKMIIKLEELKTKEVFNIIF